MRKSIKILMLALAAMLIAGGASSVNAKDKKGLKYNSNTEYNAEALGRNTEDIKVVRLEGKGETEEAATEDAMMKAVACALFCGFPSAGDGVTQPTPAIISDANAEVTYKQFLTEFFKPGGDYKKYVAVSTIVPTKASSKVSKNLYRVRIGMDVSYNALKEEMKKNGVVK
ncbi:MAG: hypothetical protein J6T12_01125 [Salinivirgaceae bacterium]|nr:hypothetical protein [Salinivirgaceae bacterium]